MAQSNVGSKNEHQARQLARTKYNDLIAKAKQRGKAPSEGDQRRIVYQARAGGIDDQMIMQALQELGVTEITKDLPVPKVVTQSIPVPVAASSPVEPPPADETIVVLIPKPARRPVLVGQ